ncbi:hypothetical protein ACKGJI_04595 [Sulfurospirillum sp. 1307]
MIYTNLSDEQIKKAIQTKIKIKQNKKSIYNYDFFSDMDRKSYLISIFIDEDVCIVKNTFLIIKVYLQRS